MLSLFFGSHDEKTLAISLDLIHSRFLHSPEIYIFYLFICLFFTFLLKYIYFDKMLWLINEIMYLAIGEFFCKKGAMVMGIIVLNS